MRANWHVPEDELTNLYKKTRSTRSWKEMNKHSFIKLLTITNVEFFFITIVMPKLGRNLK